MVQTIAVTEAITDLNEAHRRFDLRQANRDFFPEWQTDLPELSEHEKAALAHYGDRYLDYAAEGFISEGTVNVILVSPLLELLGLCDSPYRIRGERYVEIAIENEDTVLRGRIDALIVQNQLWINLIEAKHFGFSVLQAVPQTLAYMMAYPPTQPVVYGLVTTGEDYIFLKLNRAERQYALSYKFTLLADENNNLHRVVRILKQIKQMMA